MPEERVNHMKMDGNYELVDIPYDQRPPQSNESVYTAPIASQILKQTYYHLPQVNTSSSKKLIANKTVQKVNAVTEVEARGHSKTKCCLIAISLLVVAMSVLTLAAISLGMHSLLKDGHKEDAEVLSEETANYSHLHVANEIQELKLQLQQLVSDARRNNSQIATQLHFARSSNSQLASLLDLARQDITRVQSDIGRINGRTENSQNPYQNCRKDKTTCTLPNSSTAVPYCLTPTQEINISNYYTLDISCELSRWYNYDAHEVATLYEVVPGGSAVVCKCSVTQPNPSGHATVSIPSSRSIQCSLVITRCPLS